MDPNNDYTFGRSQGNFWVDAPDGVAQHVFCRMMLWTGQWFADSTEGTAWATDVLGERTQATRDLVVVDRVRTTPHVTDILAYGSRHDPDTRTWEARMKIDTEYGEVTLRAARLPGSIPPLPSVAVTHSPFTTRLIGVTSGDTPITATPADLSDGPRADIEDFTIIGTDGGTY
jgi:hypothetical protein